MVLLWFLIYKRTVFLAHSVQKKFLLNILYNLETAVFSLAIGDKIYLISRFIHCHGGASGWRTYPWRMQ